MAWYWNRPVSVTTPAYRHAAASGGMSPPIRFINRNTTSAVEEAAGSTSGMVPSPSLLTWWSIQITVPARAATGASCPSRSIEALSSVTSTAGSFGKAFGSTRPSVPGSAFTHGASSNARAPLLVALADAFGARGLTVFRYDLPFRQARPTGPPTPGGAARDREGLRGAVEAVRASAPGRVFLGGHSYGGRQASILAAGEPGLANALLLLSYPLHPPGRAGEPRTAHFPGLGTPALFVHGSADPFGSLDELERARGLIPARTALLPVDGAGHDLLRGRRQARAELAERIAAAFLEFVRSVAHAVAR